ncbi:MAG: EAL domain-containing protein, partial [Wujia sp.]
PIIVNGKSIHLRFRAAATMFPDDSEFLDQIQSNLFYALDHAKMTNAEDVVFYSKELYVRKTQAVRLKETIHECVEDNCKGFRIVMQPIMDAHAGACDCAEVLLRFSHPDYDAVSPMDFIPILESSREIIKVGKWVIDESLRTMADWYQRGDRQKLPLQRLHINVSYVQFKDLTLLDYVVNKLDEYNLPHEVLVLELTESCRIEKTTFLSEVLQQFKDAGISVALDDFGTGYASLAVLKDIPADVVKIDHTMTRNIVDRPKDKALIEFIVTYSQKVGIQVCAEGVETMEALMIVKNAGVDSVQGYYYDKPLELETFYKKYIEKA